LLISLAVNAWGLRLFGGSVDYQRFGTIGEWVSGAGTVAAVVAALNIARAEATRQRSQIRAAADAAMSQVFVWLRLRYSDVTEAPTHWEVLFNNATPQPVYFWVAKIERLDGHMCHVVNGPLLPGESSRVFAEPNEAPPLMDEQTRRASIEFLDVEGRWWVRNMDGSCALRRNDAVQSTAFHSCDGFDRRLEMDAA